VKDPGEVVKAGQIVKVRVISADVKSKRIALSMKTAGGVAPAPFQRAEKKAVVVKTKVAAPVLSMEDKLAALGSKWKVR